jgi:hypothetical protein
MNPNKTPAPPTIPAKRTEWGFTAEPDFPRICRELEDAGCAFGVVCQNGGTVTVFHSKKCQVGPLRAHARIVTDAPNWWCVAGDHSARIILERQGPVSVRGYGAPPSPPAAAKAIGLRAEAEAIQLHQLAQLRKAVAAYADATWTQADGAKVRVQAMSDAHLHFALAKAYRGEFAVSADRMTGIEALKAEATRRLLLSKLPEPVQERAAPKHLMASMPPSYPGAPSPRPPSPMTAPKKWRVFSVRQE